MQQRHIELKLVHDKDCTYPDRRADCCAELWFATNLDKDEAYVKGCLLLEKLKSNDVSYGHSKILQCKIFYTTWDSSVSVRCDVC